jgi:hypothetical protein
MNHEFRRILFGIQGGFPLAQEDLEVLQNSLSDRLGMMAVAACLGQNSIIFGGAPVHTGSTMDIAACTVLLDGIMMACPAQSVAGTTAANFWLTPESATDSPLQFQDGSVHDTRETRTAKIIYADAQPSGGVRVADMKVYAQLLTDSLVKPVTDPLARDLAEIADRTERCESGFGTLAQYYGNLANAIDDINANKVDVDTLADSGWVDLSGLITIQGLTEKIFRVYRKNHTVFINMSIYGLSGSSNGYDLLTLPEKYRPSIKLGPAFSHNSGLSDLIINTNGLILFTSGTNNTAWGQTVVSYPV